MPYCQNCGKEISATANFCTSCGAPKGTTPAGMVQIPGKSKTASILLAVFLGFWTWVYTYKRDYKKFWTALVVYFITFAIFFAFTVYIVIYIPMAISGFPVASNAAEEIFFLLWILFIVMPMACTGIWIWSILDTAVKSDNWYKNY